MSKRRAIDVGATPSGLAVVLAVVAALAALGFQAAHRYSAYTVAAHCRADKRDTQQAVAAYYAQFDVYPATVDTLVGNGLLRKAPGGAGYTITYDGDGQVTATGACS
jgi:hypothetical protein